MSGLSCLHTTEQYFKDLAQFLDHEPELCSSIETIHLCCDPPHVAQASLTHAVLNELILQSKLKHLVLRNFAPGTVIAALATLRFKKKLETLDLECNQLTTNHFVMVLESLGEDVRVDLNVSDNVFDDEERIGIHLAHCNNLKSITFGQQSASWDKDKLIQEITAYEMDDVPVFINHSTT